MWVGKSYMVAHYFFSACYSLSNQKLFVNLQTE